MFAKYQDDKTRDWNSTIQRYISLHKYIKEVGKISISQARSGHVDTEVQAKLADALRQTDKTYCQLKNFLKPCLTTVDVTDIFPQEKVKIDVESLNQEISKLKHENDSLRQELSEQYRIYGGDAGLQIRNLQRNLSLNQQDFNKKYESLQQEKYYLEQKVFQLTQEIETLRLRYQNLLSLDENDIQQLNKNGNLQVTHIKRQQELEETLKTQNDLIYNLKQQLLESERDREIFKSLNRTLEMELQKKAQREFSQECISKKIPEELGNENDYDYFTRSTLKIGEYNPQMNIWKKNQKFGKYFQLGNEIEIKIEPKFNSLQEIPVYYEQEKTYMKSKSYEYEIDDNSITVRDYNLQEKQELEEKKGIQYLINQEEQINKEEKNVENQDNEIL